MIRALFQDQRRARPGRQDIILEIGEVRAFPDRQRSGGCFPVPQRRLAVKKRNRNRGSRNPPPPETPNVPSPPPPIPRIKIYREKQKIQPKPHTLCIPR